MLYAYAIRYASRCCASLAIISYNIPYTCTHIVSYRITYYPARTHAAATEPNRITPATYIYPT